MTKYNEPWRQDTRQLCNVLYREVECAALAKSLLKSEFKKMSAIHFKQALCMELLRCEGILKEKLPSIIKVWDAQGLTKPCASAGLVYLNSPPSQGCDSRKVKC